MVTLTRRRKILEKRRTQQRKAIAASLKRQTKAWLTFTSKTRTQFANNISKVYSTTLRFCVHSSHVAVECGGYVGCLSCGASIMRPKEGQRLATRCLPKRCKTSGSFYRVRRIAQGLHPYGQGQLWPNGTVAPTPNRVAHPRPSIAQERAIRRWRWLGLQLLAKVTAIPPMPTPPRRFKITTVWSKTWGPEAEGLNLGEDQGASAHPQHDTLG